MLKLMPGRDKTRKFESSKNNGLITAFKKSIASKKCFIQELPGMMHMDFELIGLFTDISNTECFLEMKQAAGSILTAQKFDSIKEYMGESYQPFGNEDAFWKSLAAAITRFQENERGIYSDLSIPNPNTLAVVLPQLLKSPIDFDFNIEWSMFHHGQELNGCYAGHFWIEKIVNYSNELHLLEEYIAALDYHNDIKSTPDRYFSHSNSIRNQIKREIRRNESSPWFVLIP